MVLKIIIVFVYPPIPIRTSDYQAYVDGNEELGNYGNGRTALEALADLIDQFPEQIRFISANCKKEMMLDENGNRSIFDDVDE